MERSCWVVDESETENRSGSDAGDRRVAQVGKTVRAGRPGRNSVPGSGSGARSKHTARRSTGGKAPRRALASAAARRVAGYGEEVVAVKWAPGTTKYAREMPLQVKLASAGVNSPPSRADIKRWSEHALG